MKLSLKSVLSADKPCDVCWAVLEDMWPVGWEKLLLCPDVGKEATWTS